jgi:hypothetical protein
VGLLLIWVLGTASPLFADDDLLAPGADGQVVTQLADDDPGVIVAMAPSPDDDLLAPSGLLAVSWGEGPDDLMPPDPAASSTVLSDRER